MPTLQQTSRFAGRIETLKPSCVREIMARMGATELINFAAGLPAPALFPVEAIAAAAAQVLQSDPDGALQYGTTEGYLPLREWIAEHLLLPRGIPATAANILLVSGSQQALDLLGKVFLDPGDRVLLERPAYMAAIQAFDLCQARYATADLHADGIDLNEVRQHLRDDGQPVRLVYAVPTFHNPTGHSYSEANRRGLASLLAEHPAILVEDEPYAALRYDGVQGTPLAALRPANTVMLGTFSKVFTPGFRMGWMYGSPEVIRKLTIAKQASDLCGNQLSQRLLLRYLLDNDLQAHVAQLRAFYKDRRDAMLSLLRELMPHGTSWTQPEGGMFIWLRLPRGCAALALLERTIARGVAFSPGDSFFACRPQTDCLRLNFTFLEPPMMRKGLAILAQEMKTMLGGT